MTVPELIARFPEIPAGLRALPVLEEFARTFDSVLKAARAPSPCSREHDAANHYYLKLIGPLAIHGYGLSTQEHVVEELTTMMRQHAENPDGFAAGLIPATAAERERRGPGCDGS